MRIREPVVAGRFYAAGADRCKEELQALLAELPDCQPQGDKLLGGLVPHAGWMCSGAVAAEVFLQLSQSAQPDVIVLFGGVHRYRGREGAMFASGRWETPVGAATIDGRLAERIMGHTNLIVDDPFAHESEHSIEVQVPLVVHLFPGVKIVPIMVPPTGLALEIGASVAHTIRAYRYHAMVIGTTDLTHYGSGYGFTPHGTGDDALKWAKDKNDARFIAKVCDMRADQLVDEATQHKNACSSGAVAATVSATRILGASRGTLLTHTTSGEVLAGRLGPISGDSVGYAGIVFS